MVEALEDQAQSFLSHLKLKVTLEQMALQGSPDITKLQHNTSVIQDILSNWIHQIVEKPCLQRKTPGKFLLDLAKSFERLHYPLMAKICCELIAKSYQNEREVLRDAYIYLAEQLETQGEPLQAVHTYQKLNELDLDKHIAFNRIGLVFLSIHEFEQALINFERSLQIDPNYLQAQINMGVAHQSKGRYPKAIQCFEAVISKDPLQVNAYYNLGIAYFCTQSYALSLESLNNALKLNPLLLDAHYNKGVVYSQLKNHPLAIECYNRVIVSDPQYVLAHYNLGVCYFELLDYAQALLCYAKALEIDPDHIRSHWNLAHCYLILGNLEKGLRHYEWRWRHNELQNNQKQREFVKPLWMGQSTLTGKSILLHAEQGFGDTLQFIRYAIHLGQSAAKVIIEVQPALKSLIAMSFQGKEALGRSGESGKSVADWSVIARGEEIPPYDFHCPLMSLPLALGFKSVSDCLGTLPPYLRVDDALKELWAYKLEFLLQQKKPRDPLENSRLPIPDLQDSATDVTSVRRRPRIGLVWSSGYREDQSETWEINKERNLDLSGLEELLRLPFDWVSLQIGKIPNQELQDLNQSGWRGRGLLDLSTEIKSFADTAAIAQNLDLIITVDTSTAHLCGALGLKTWVLLKSNACWRWFLQTEQSPFYPSTRLLRQTQKGDWSGALLQLHTELKALVAEQN